MSTDLSDSVSSVPHAATRKGFLGVVAHVFGGWHFPVVAMTLLVGFAAMVLAVMWAPADTDGFGAFAAEFKRWCFGWDGVGAVSTVQVLFMVSELLLFALVLAILWRAPLRAAWATRRRAVAATIGVGLVALSMALAVLVRIGAPALATPGGVHDLRTSRLAPALRLTDQNGAVVDLAALRGRVVVVTAVYSTCGNTCPMLLGQAKRMLTAVTAARPALVGDLRILTVTLDPAHDTAAVRAEVANNQALASPPWHLLGGAEKDVEATLSRWEVAHRRDPETGQIDHANLFMVVDRQGRLAYRLALSQARESWLVEAVTALLEEAP